MAECSRARYRLCLWWSSYSHVATRTSFGQYTCKTAVLQIQTKAFLLIEMVTHNPMLLSRRKSNQVPAPHVCLLSHPSFESCNLPKEQRDDTCRPSLELINPIRACRWMVPPYHYTRCNPTGRILCYSYTHSNVLKYYATLTLRGICRLFLLNRQQTDQNNRNGERSGGSDGRLFLYISVFVRLRLFKL